MAASMVANGEADPFARGGNFLPALSLLPFWGFGRLPDAGNA